MSYNTDELIKEAVEFGFSQAAELNTSALVFMPEVRDMCGPKYCRQFGKNWCCPPACGTLEESSERAAQYSYGIIVQTIGQMDDDFDYEGIMAASEKHTKNFYKFAEMLKERYSDVLLMGAGTCEICETCTYPDAPCRYPDKAISSMEAYGLWVSKVCELSGIAYNNGKQTMTFVSCYLLK